MNIDLDDFNNFTKGKRDAFENIFHFTYPTLVSFATQHSLDLMVSEDIVIEALHKAWEKRDKIKSPSSLKSFLFTTVHNKSINTYRNDQNRKRILSEDIKIENIVNFRDLLIEEEVSRLLYEAINELPNKTRNVITLFMQGLSLNEIAEDLNVSINTVKTQKLSGLKTLKKKLKSNILLFTIINTILNNIN